MPSFVRKNLARLTGTFAPPPCGDDIVQPTGVTVHLHYRSFASGLLTEESLNASYDGTALVWFVEWDTSACKGGRVDWVVFSAGSSIAAAQGTFEVLANEANDI